MRAYRLASDHRIAPFGDLARDLYVGVKTIDRWQRDACAACGLELADAAGLDEAVERPAIVFSDGVFFTEMALRQFVASVMGKSEDARLAMPDSAVLRAWRVLDDEGPIEGGAQSFDVFYVASAAPLSSLEALRAQSARVVQAASERTTPIKLPLGTKDGERSAEAPIGNRVVADVRHWLHLLRLSQLSVGVTLIDRLRKKPFLALKLRLTSSKDPWARARKVSFVDPTARVHPTADLELAVIGPGTVVRAHAHVHRSVLGANVEVGDHAVVVGSTLADEVQVLSASYLAYCASMPGSTLASYKVQLSLFGKGVFLTSSAWLIDAKLQGEVRVEHEGRLVSIHSAFLGSCLGHRVTLGAQVAIQGGRAVPNDSVIIAPPGTFAESVPTYPKGTLLTVRDGRVVPIDPSER